MEKYWKSSYGIICGLISISASCSTSFAAMTFGGWNFNGAVGTSAPSIGKGTASTIGGVSANFSAGDPADDQATVPAENKGWNLASFASQGTASGERGAVFQCSTVGYESAVVTWHERHSNSASRFVQFQYAIDGSTFTSEGIANGGIFEATLGGDVWQTERRVDLGSIQGVAGNGKFAVRIVSIFAPNTSAYAPTSLTANYSPSGTVRFDLVTFEGVAVPAPAALALGIAGAAAVGMGSRRRD